ncbi:hypothetical protein P296_10500 [Salmonella enterica subsp. arizonae serovar 18:z4,z23:- str. CVM N26624]|uniref:Uncharacterized protein n=1 Tax=Salmonella enterica subsp. arizonae serovar 18:z4,z23:- str. CVM N26626 TaxID=1395119 RepID=A0A3S5YFU7_SALER|nr:hypothetical protein N898_02865 [Salmonella enterica subsp. arizonae serovar 62:z36:- str. RKS2983]OLV95023.1 hypothetical protein P298_03295 [Salmonella enterica subsp. arizonae serovar 18:z4,z23:- str. CVM N26626]OLV98794.1 hypothetical protein P297_16795 [Salmonella enterica subsp. arizonae serovar 18:z4,z23:- str. CVM N26625]OLW02762.1 hypothetical protein P296_10500 [Salmonella enterica subsp. arizonae serovar 18:z4,z23:- str. CVM N26624]OLW11608.1 hypothetical protein P295_11290 [Salmo
MNEFPDSYVMPGNLTRAPSARQENRSVFAERYKYKDYLKMFSAKYQEII